MKFVIVFVIIGLAAAQRSERQEENISAGNIGETNTDFKHHFPSYKFAYGVEDHHTGDIKHQWEHRHGDAVEGEYWLKEADGTMRLVKYFANDKDGFNAVVKKVGKAHQWGMAHDSVN